MESGGVEGCEGLGLSLVVVMVLRNFACGCRNSHGLAWAA